MGLSTMFFCFHLGEMRKSARQLTVCLLIDICHTPAVQRRVVRRK